MKMKQHKNNYFHVLNQHTLITARDHLALMDHYRQELLLVLLSVSLFHFVAVQCVVLTQRKKSRSH